MTIKQQFILLLHRFSAVMVLVLSVGILGAPVFVSASSIANLSQTYSTTSTNIAQGTLLSLASSSSTDVVPASNESVSRLVGIAVDKPIVGSGNTRDVQVAVGGSVQAIVSDINGPVLAGDKITASPVAGIGMRATNASEVVGVTQASLNSVQTVTQTFTGTNGRPVSVHVGLLPISVTVDFYATTPAAQPVSAYVPPFIQNLANTVAGKSVSPLRALISGIALFLCFATIIVMLSVGIRSHIISLGRNPLAADALRGGMVDILLTALGVLVITCAAIAVTIGF